MQPRDRTIWDVLLTLTLLLVWIGFVALIATQLTGFGRHV